jgi:alpha-mannosidase
MVAFTPVKIVGKGRGDSQLMAEFSKEGIRDWWNESINAGQTFHSWVMTNHWEVNYKAYQEGPVTFRYALIPHHGSYSGVEAEKSGREVCQPLLAVEVNRDRPTVPALFSFASDRLIATSLKPDHHGDGLILRIFNPGSSRGIARLSAKDGTSLRVQHCDPSGIPTGPADGVIALNGYGVATLRIEILEGQN